MPISKSEKNNMVNIYKVMIFGLEKEENYAIYDNIKKL